jgi:hypothetical protein
MKSMLVNPQISIENLNPCTFAIVPGSVAIAYRTSHRKIHKVIKPHHIRVKVHNLLHVHYGVHHYKPLG